METPMSIDGSTSFPERGMPRLRPRECSCFDGERHDELMLSLLRRDRQPKS